MLKTGPSFSLVSHVCSVLGVFLKMQIVSHCAKIVFLQHFGDVKNQVFEKKIAFFFLCWRNRNRKKKKKKMEKAPKSYKNSVF